MKRCYSCMKEYSDEHEKCPHCGYDNNSKPKEQYHMVPGTILNGRYIIGVSVGQGGFGITYAGWDLQLNRKVAVKEYFPSDFATRAMGTHKLTIYNGEAGEQFGKGLESFIDEAQRLAKFNGIKGIVDIYDTFIENNTGYIVMEFLSGISVKEMLKANGVIDYPTAKEIVVEMLYILREVHKEGFIHRDIAPDNIFITDSGEFKLLDFGAARFAATSQSKSLSVILKPGYAPEEQYRSHGNQGPWTDIYALAATFYKLITGVTPPESMERRTGDTLVMPSKMGAAIPKNDEIALLNALNVLPENRIQSAQEFLDALGGKKVVRKKERNLNPDTGKMNKFIIPVSGAVVAVLIGFLICIKVGIIDITYWSQVFKSMELPEGYILIRNVVDYKADTAESLLENDGLTVTFGESFYSDAVEENKIAAQTPGSGAAEEYSVITLSQSLGPEKGETGVFLGMLAEDVKTQLEEAGFYNVVIETGTENRIAEGCVERIEASGIIESYNNDGGAQRTTRDLDENENVNLSAKIVIYSSTGENIETDADGEVTVTSYVGKSYDSARTALAQLGFQIGSVTYEYSDTVKDGYIISQSPAGTKAKVGSTVTFVVSKGKEGSKTVSIPNVVGKTRAAATSTLESAGFSVKAVEGSNSYTAGLVYNQSKTGTAKEGTTITIYVSTGPAAANSGSKSSSSSTSSSSSKSSSSSSSSSRSSSTETTTKKQVTVEKTTREPKTETTTINDKNVQGVITEDRKMIKVGQSYQIKTNIAIKSCTSDKPSVASVTDSGLVTGHRTGEATITIRFENGTKAVYRAHIYRDDDYDDEEKEEEETKKKTTKDENVSGSAVS